ncbi:hypothetical protein [Umezawaea sp. Da 62-37]|uniref:hypothetical protein n=1 Tax=Umezawaea sp. Da 62-37 TaxID=3075927 RepID=UPI0028F72512|nr:hypothetical protein [Umezawaea sp. Da 62-37]WNV82515.1 hypothetical protein RM788_30445 [Umezawaea sp. Da 62-37]
MDEGLRAVCEDPGLVEFWRVAVETMEAGRSAFSFQVGDEETAAALSVVLHKPVGFPGRRQVSLVKLDEHLRREGVSLVEVLEGVHGRGVEEPAGQMGWRSQWLAQVRRYEGIPGDQLAGVVGVADRVLKVVLAGPGWGWPSELEDVVVRRVVVRAVALAFGVGMPEGPAAEAEVWRVAGLKA